MRCYIAAKQGTRELLRWTPKTMQDTLDVLEHMQDRFQTVGRIDLDKVIAS